MADSLRSTTPVSGAGGFAGRAPAEPPAKPALAPVTMRQAGGDRIEVSQGVALARRVLRERVLTRTRTGLELAEGEHVPTFAEVIDDEPVSLFVDRLLSAQNQLGARRQAAWGAARVRRALDAALRDGAAEAIDLLVRDGRDDGAAAALVADVLAEYARRLAALAADGDRSA